MTEEKAEDIFNKDVLARILEEVRKGKINERQVKEVLERLALGSDVEKALEFEEQNEDEIEEKIIKLLKEKPGLSPNAYMGLLMREFKGKIDAKTLMDLIVKHQN
jgi:Asp-tRNA(Asn)/Glu-tRNA(Gln) amidotransferase B subunit